ncbi:non-structural maintenance of chromosomes element 4 homolog A isoform X2 [Rhea pennata]|uniref:non-structural maintenance of chromosomes element 4 homolog A isoform X2 n=1 Tax=Rhea pennata TaxID=8795 RepID=UPI002E272AB4
MSEAGGSGDFSSPRSSGSDCSRPSLPSTSRNGAVSEHKQQRLSGGLGRPRPPASEDEEEEEEPEVAWGRPRRPESAEATGGGDERSRRMIRNQYRELIYSVQLSCAREAALDAQFLVLASNLGKEKANELHSEMTAFDSPAYAEDLLTFMGLNRIEVEEKDSDNEGISGGYLPSNAWHKLGSEAEKYFRRAPSFHYMLGSFKADPPVPRQRIERQKKTTGREEKRAMPAQLKKMEESHQEATEKEVERILGFLQTHFKNDPDAPISFFDLVIDPNSFARTVENIFHVSFIIRDGFARLKLDEDKLPVIEPAKDDEGNEDDRSAQVRNQAVISLSHQEWKEIVETFEITEPVIGPPCNSNEDEMEIA